MNFEKDFSSISMRLVNWGMTCLKTRKSSLLKVPDSNRAKPYETIPRPIPRGKSIATELTCNVVKRSNEADEIPEHNKPFQSPSMSTSTFIQLLNSRRVNVKARREEETRARAAPIIPRNGVEPVTKIALIRSEARDILMKACVFPMDFRAALRRVL